MKKLSIFVILCIFSVGVMAADEDDDETVRPTVKTVGACGAYNPTEGKECKASKPVCFSDGSCECRKADPISHVDFGCNP